MNWGHRKTPHILTFCTKLLIALFIAILIFVLIMDSRAEGEQEPKEPTYILHVVEAGESLWGIAGQYDTGMSRQEAVYWIREDNGVSPLIHPGDVLRVRVAP